MDDLYHFYGDLCRIAARKLLLKPSFLCCDDPPLYGALYPSTVVDKGIWVVSRPYEAQQRVHSAVL